MRHAIGVLAILLTAATWVGAVAPDDQVAEQKQKQSADTVFAIDVIKEPLASSLIRLKLFKPSELTALFSIDPAKTIKLQKLDDKEQPLFEEKQILGAELRDAFTTAKALSIDDRETPELRKVFKATLETSLAHDSEEPNGATYPIDPEKETLAASFDRNNNFTEREKKHLESINPHKQYTISKFDDKGNPVPLTGTTTGLAIRQAFALCLNYNRSEQLDATALTRLNLALYGTSTAPAATDAAARDRGVSKFKAARKLLKEWIAADK